MEPKLFVNKLTKNVVATIGSVLDSTTSQPDDLVLYVGLDDPQLFVAPASVFHDLHSPVVGSEHSEVIERQSAGLHFPLLDILCGFIAKAETITGPLIASVMAPHMAMLEGSKDEDDAVLRQGYLSAVGSLSLMEKAGLFSTLLVKIQRPLTSSVDNPPCLVYNESREFISEMAMDKNILELLGDEAKVYAYARLWVNGVFQVVCLTEDQQW